MHRHVCRYIASPPCMWGRREDGLEPPPRMNGVALYVKVRHAHRPMRIDMWIDMCIYVCIDMWKGGRILFVKVGDVNHIHRKTASSLLWLFDNALIGNC